jgi:hypothetical protein
MSSLVILMNGFCLQNSDAGEGLISVFNAKGNQ